MRIATKDLGKRFNREWIFRKFNFVFQPGNYYAIVGPNGSGKSTLLQVLCGQVPPSFGKLEYEKEGVDVPIEEVFNHISIAAPYMDLIEEFTLLEMLQFHFKFKKSFESKSVEELMELMELDHAKNKLVANFSSGMKQRLKLGLALFSSTPILFLDEPTTNLDKTAIQWYLSKLVETTEQRLVIIASNQEHEYPEEAQKVDLSALK